MTKTSNSIFLAIMPPSGPEVHVRWRGHTIMETATQEISQLRNVLLKQHKKPYDCYIYEAQQPPFGLKAHEVDDVDMNFYEENTSTVDIEEVNKKLNKAIYEVGILARDEAKQEGKI